VDIADHDGRRADETATIERIPDETNRKIELLWETEWQKNLMDVAIRRVKQQVRAKQWQIFDFYVLKEWPVSKVTKILGVNMGQVYLARHRVTRLIKKELEELKKSML
jgi:RNA polymerase sigma-70 factor (ECF subfamily)